MSQRLAVGLTCLAAIIGSSLSLAAAEPASRGLFARKNLVAWCIVPFDSKKRGPEERAAMLEKLGFTQFAYDYRAEHIPTFDAEIEALKRHHVELSAWWFPTSLNDEAKMTLAVFAKHKVTPQLWVTGGGGPTKDEADQRARVVAEAARIRPIADAAKQVGCKVALYNHGGWFGEPENQIAILQELKLDNVGIVYNLHHGHDHLDRFPELLQKMKPYLYTLNLNGMVRDGERKGQKILQLGEGDLDLKLLKIIRDSGYTGPIGILGHTQDDAEERLHDNLDGLDWLLPQLDGKQAGPKPKMRTPVPRAVAAAGVAPPAVSNKPLVEGKFGQALDGRAGGAFVAGRDEFRQFPITVECWTRLADKSTFNILVAHEQKPSGTHWEIFSMAGTGNFTAYLPGFAPDHCNTNAMICDNQWHHVAMVLEPERVRLYVDGKSVADQPHQRSGKATEPGGLALASLVDRAIGCTGLVDEVRISKGIRLITAIPDKPFVVDETTIALWHFDELVEKKRFDDASPKKNAALLGDTGAGRADAAKNAAKTGKIEGHWGEDAIGFRWTEADSHDERFGKVDSGPFFSGSITGAGGPVYKGIVVRLGTKREASILYDTELLRVAAGWNGFLKFDSARFGIIVPPKIDGEATFSTPRFPGVSRLDQFTNFREAHPYGPLPKEVAHYNGLYRHGQRVVLKYTVGTNGDGTETAILESPWWETADGVSAITRTMLVDPSAVPLRMMVADAKANVRLHPSSSSATLVEQPGIGRVMMIAPHDKPVTIKLLMASSGANEAAFDRLVAASPAPQDLLPLIQPGPTLWGEPLITRGEVAFTSPVVPLERPTRPGNVKPDNAKAGSDPGRLGSESPAYVVDTITLPFDNPFNALFFCGGHDFFPDGRAAVCTLHGDVWLVDGIDAKLERITWRRFATGLFQPLGLRIVGSGKSAAIYVVGRDQITRLQDLNGDGEADFYENFNNDAHVTLNGHEYVTCLETDRAGNFYYVKGNNNSQTPHDGSLLRVSADGSKLDVFATGFRNSNGIGMGPHDEITVAPQEGEWTPASAVFLVKEGGFYGGMMSHHRPTPPTDFERPLVWFPRLADNSSGGQVWTTSNRWGPLSNRLLHMSYGQCRLRLVLRDEGQLPPLTTNNGASIELPLRFNSGIHRGRMNPLDGQLYVTGLKGWTTSAVHDGCFQRVRYTGQPLNMLVGFESYKNGVALTFTQELDREAAQEPSNYQMESWNYKWSAAYGSPDYKPSAPGQIGHDEVEVRSATLLEKRTVFLELPDLKPVDQLAINATLFSWDGRPVEQTAVLTLNSISDDAYPQKQLYRKAEDPERARLLASLVPGIQVNVARNPQSVQRLLAWEIEDGWQTISATGWIKIPYTGRYRFSAQMNHPVPVSVDPQTKRRLNALTLQIGQNHNRVTDEGFEVSLSRGMHPIKLVFLTPATEKFRLRLMWESDRFPLETIPASLLMHTPAEDQRLEVRQSGAMLFEQFRCSSCHQKPDSTFNDAAAPAPFDNRGFFEILRAAPRLDGIGSRLETNWLAHWIREPHQLRPEATMPAVVAPNDNATANDIAAYLATLREPAAPDPAVPDAAEIDTLVGTGADLYERLGCIACHTVANPEQKETWNRVSLHFVNAKYRPPALVKYLLTPHSHHPNSRMPDFRLTEPEAAALAQFLHREAHGRLQAIDGQAAGNAERGRVAFAKNRCAQCHVVAVLGQLAKADVPTIRWQQEPTQPPRNPLPAAVGCLAAQVDPNAKSARFPLNDADRTALIEFCTSSNGTEGTHLPMASARSVDAWTTQLRCNACHTRDARQAPWPEIIAEEGSGRGAESVPQLTWVGEKLQGPWIEKLLTGQVQQKPRPWLKARMPAFPAYASLLAHGMAEEHGVPFEEPLPEKLMPSRVEAGRKLTMRDGGLDCRQCHGVGKEQPRGDASTQIALGINFSLTKDRLRPEFALRQMLDPPRYDVGSRMPRFAPDLQTTAAKQIENGDARKQFELLKEFLWSVHE